MRTLVLNLTRFGDLIQTQPVIAGLAADGQDVRLLCLKNFAAAAGLLDGVERAAPFSGARLLALLDRDWRLAVAELLRVPARMLARFAALGREGSPASVLGFGVDEFGFNADTSAWAAFLQVGSSNRGASPFNLVDLFCRAAGLGEGPHPFRLKGPSEELARAMEERIRAGLPPEARDARLVGVQLGASEERRRWPVARFAEAARILWERSGRAAVLFGSRGELPLAERFVSEARSPFVSLVGATGLDELAGALRAVDLLLTNDTGTMHLAAGLGVPVAAVFLATAQPFDTGPYAEGALSFEPDMDCHPCAFGKPCPREEACRGRVLARTVAAHALAMLGEGEVPEAEGARVWRSGFDEYGLMSLASLSGHGATDRAAWIGVQRFHYRRFLDGLDPAQPEGAALPGAEMRAGLARSLGEARELLFLLERQMEMLRSGATGPAGKLMKERFLSNCQRLQEIFSANPGLDVLGALWFFQSQAEGRDLASLASLLSRWRGLVSGMAASVS
jgi:ADP-heptose:LPS heptosyltransferase